MILTGCRVRDQRGPPGPRAGSRGGGRGEGAESGDRGGRGGRGLRGRGGVPSTAADEPSRALAAEGGRGPARQPRTARGSPTEGPPSVGAGGRHPALAVAAEVLASTDSDSTAGGGESRSKRGKPGTIQGSRGSSRPTRLPASSSPWSAPVTAPITAPTPSGSQPTHSTVADMIAAAAAAAAGAPTDPLRPSPLDPVVDATPIVKPLLPAGLDLDGGGGVQLKQPGIVGGGFERSVGPPSRPHASTPAMPQLPADLGLDLMGGAAPRKLLAGSTGTGGAGFALAPAAAVAGPPLFNTMAVAGGPMLWETAPHALGGGGAFSGPRVGGGGGVGFPFPPQPTTAGLFGVAVPFGLGGVTTRPFQLPPPPHMGQSRGFGGQSDAFVPSNKQPDWSTGHLAPASPNAMAGGPLLGDRGGGSLPFAVATTPGGTRVDGGSGGNVFSHGNPQMPQMPPLPANLMGGPAGGFVTQQQHPQHAQHAQHAQQHHSLGPAPGVGGKGYAQQPYGVAAHHPGHMQGQGQGQGGQQQSRGNPQAPPPHPSASDPSSNLPDELFGGADGSHSHPQHSGHMQRGPLQQAQQGRQATRQAQGPPTPSHPSSGPRAEAGRGRGGRGGRGPPNGPHAAPGVQAGGVPAPAAAVGGQGPAQGGRGDGSRGFGGRHARGGGRTGATTSTSASVPLSAPGPSPAVTVDGQHVNGEGGAGDVESVGRGGRGAARGGRRGGRAGQSGDGRGHHDSNGGRLAHEGGEAAAGPAPPPKVAREAREGGGTGVRAPRERGPRMPRQPGPPNQPSSTGAGGSWGGAPPPPPPPPPPPHPPLQHQAAVVATASA